MSKFSENMACIVQKRRWLHRLATGAENIVKKPIFGCQDCGQCVLSQNAFTCPMRCPKQMRNGPCGGTRADGHCEVYPERNCIWMLIYTRSKKLGWQAKLTHYSVPVDRRNENTSAWMNMFAGRIEPICLGKDCKVVTLKIDKPDSK